MATATTTDLVFAREFFLLEHRANLPQVPACTACNNKKASLEHYLTAVLPFGGRHDSAPKNLGTMVPKRLSKNAKLHRSLRETSRRMWDKEGNVVVPVSAIPLDSDSLAQVFTYIARGLTRFHWGVVVRHNCSLTVRALTPGGENYFDSLFAMDAAARVSENLGHGTFVYEGAQGIDAPESGLWRFEIYGGTRFADTELPGVVSHRIGVILVPQR